MGDGVFYKCKDIVVVTDNKYVIDYCKKNNIKYQSITKKEGLSITEALQKLNKIKD